MLQTPFRSSCMNRASVFDGHKRFKEGRESVRDDEKCGRRKEVRTLELIGQMKNFMDEDHRVSIETISAQLDVSVGTLHTIIREELKMRKICPMGAQRRSERKTLSWQQGDGRADQFRSRSSWCSGDLRWKLDLLLWPREQETYFPVEACWLSQTQECQTEKIHPQTSDDPFFWQHWHDLHALGSHWTDSQQVMLYSHLHHHSASQRHNINTDARTKTQEERTQEWRTQEQLRCRKKDTERLLYNYIYLSLYCKGSKGLFKGCMWEDAGDRT